MRCPEWPDIMPKILCILSSPLPVCIPLWMEGQGKRRTKVEGIFCSCLMPLSLSVWGWLGCQSNDLTSIDRAGAQESPSESPVLVLSLDGGGQDTVVTLDTFQKGNHRSLLPRSPEGP